MSRNSSAEPEIPIEQTRIQKKETRIRWFSRWDKKEKSSWKKVLLLLAPLLAGPALFLPELSSSAMLFAHPVLLW